MSECEWWTQFRKYKKQKLNDSKSMKIFLELVATTFSKKIVPKARLKSNNRILVNHFQVTLKPTNISFHFDFLMDDL